jgi:glucose/arabinose dehydrogenase/sugar lactone lactonase YvrE
MKYSLRIVALLLALAAPAPAAELPKPLVTGLKNPESVAIGFGGKIFVTTIGEFDKDGDGAVMVIEDGKVKPFAEGLDDPKGMVFFQKWLFVADKKRVLKIDEKGQVDIFAPANAFPIEPLFLNDVAIDPESGTLFVSDSGNLKGKGGAVYRITPKGLVTLIADAMTIPSMNTPNGLALDGATHLLLADFGTGELHRINLGDRKAEKLADGLGSTDGLVWDQFGRLFITDYKGGKLYVIPRPGAKPVLVAEGFKAAADCCLDASGLNILVPDMTAGTVTAIPAQVPGAEVDFSPLPLKAAVAFPDLKWTGWKGESDTGKVDPLRPLVLTHAGDGSNRVFAATEQGVIHVFPNDQKVTVTKVFLDIRDRVSYSDSQNEEGFLGLAFHPKYKETGEFFVFYTPKKLKATNVVSRFRVSKDDPDKADPNSEEVLMPFKKPFWNHDGGTLAFGPDGYLYVTHGDGGSGNDPFDNAQNLKTMLGKILRIDVNAKGTGGKKYGIPKDNPFADGKDGAHPEIYAYGLRNVWRMAFDRKTGQLWAADVGQNLYEEIDLITKGGNYGWNRREALHPFGPRGSGPKPEFIDPIWEYHHDVGKSITGGTVYRGAKLPELDGLYLYGDYVTNKVWALKFDEKLGRVTANRPLKDAGAPILSFGEDEKGEVYYMTYTPTGRGIFHFVKE